MTTTTTMWTRDETSRKASFDTWATGLPAWGDRLLELGASWETFDSPTVMEDLVQGAGIPFLAARTLVQNATHAMELQNAPMAVFWDLDQTPFYTLQQNPTAVLERLQNLLSSYGKLDQIRCYTASTVSEHIRSSLVSKGCLVIEGTGDGAASIAVDTMMAVDAMKFAHQPHPHNRRATLCFVSGNSRGLSYMLGELQSWRTVVVSNNDAPTIHNQAASAATENNNTATSKQQCIYLPWPAEDTSLTTSMSPPPGLSHLEPYELDSFILSHQFFSSSPLLGDVCGTDRDVVDELYNRTIVCDNPPISPLYAPRSLVVGSKLLAASFVRDDDASDTKTSASTQEESVSSHAESLTCRPVCLAPEPQSPTVSPPTSVAAQAPIVATTTVPLPGHVPCWICQVVSPKKVMVPVCHRRSKFHCEACYNWGPPKAKALAVERVVTLMKCFALHDDIVITDSLLRHKLVERYPQDCISLPRATLWIEGAIKCGALDFLPHWGSRQKCVCLPENFATALAPQPPDTVDTTREESYLKELLTKSNGWKTRRLAIVALTEKFPKTMSTPAMRTKAVDNACAKRMIVLRGNATTQVLALTKATAECELERLTTKASQAKQ